VGARRVGDRETADLLILMLAVTVCSVVILGVLGVMFATLLDREVNPLPAYLAGAVSTLIGMVAGFLAGRR